MGPGSKSPARKRIPQKVTAFSFHGEVQLFRKPIRLGTQPAAAPLLRNGSMQTEERHSANEKRLFLPCNFLQWGSSLAFEVPGLTLKFRAE